MRRTIYATLMIAAVAAPVWADVTMTQHVASKGMGINGGDPRAAKGSPGSLSTTSTVQSIDTAALDEALFAPLAGCKVSPKK